MSRRPYVTRGQAVPKAASGRTLADGGATEITWVVTAAQNWDTTDSPATYPPLTSTPALVLSEAAIYYVAVLFGHAATAYEFDGITNPIIETMELLRNGVVVYSEEYVRGPTEYWPFGSYMLWQASTHFSASIEGPADVTVRYDAEVAGGDPYQGYIGSAFFTAVRGQDL